MSKKKKIEVQVCLSTEAKSIQQCRLGKRNLSKATEGTVGTIYGLSIPSIKRETETADSATSNHANSNNRHH